MADTYWSDIAAGAHLTIARKDDGTVWTWGWTMGSVKTSPILISGTDWNAIAAGGLHSLALKPDGTLWTWGNNQYGQLGDATTATRSGPVEVR